MKHRIVIVTRNWVKKHMETFNKPKTHADKTRYQRKAKHAGKFE